MQRRNLEALCCFLLGFGLFIFTRMSLLVPTIPFMILIAPIFILRFIRTQPAVRGNLLTFLGFVAAMNIGLFGLFDLGEGIASLVFNLMRSTLLALLYYIPFSIDRWLYPRFSRLRGLASLVFPITTTAVFFLLTREGPFEGAIQAGKFVFGPLALRQGLSLLGVSGAVFMTSWFAALVNLFWEHKWSWKQCRTVILCYVSIVIILAGFGVHKTGLGAGETRTVRTAVIVLVPESGRAEELMPLLKNRITHAHVERLALFEEKVRIASKGGAKIVLSHELAFLIDSSERESYIDRCREIARRYNIYLAIGYGYYAGEGKGQNLLMLVDDQGKILMEYAKRYLVGLGDMGETLVFRKGVEVLPYSDTPYGRLGLAICRDMEMAKYIIQAGKNDVDILLSPAYEWPQNLATLAGRQRGIENGCSLVRSSYNGISFASDPNGRVLSTMPFNEAGTGVMFADVPVRGVRTLYPHIGDLFAWICAVLFLLLVHVGIVIKAKKKIEEKR